MSNLPAFLDALWQYALQSRELNQTPQSRFATMLVEVFVAGSDLGQQLGQAASTRVFLKAKQELHRWLAQHALFDEVRIKLGSGESMQRQGCYYAAESGKPAFLLLEENRQRLRTYLPAGARRSAAYAVTPLHGVFLGGDLRTFQSNLSEHLHTLPLREVVDLLFHLREVQARHRKDLMRAAEMMAESRLSDEARGARELERLTIGARDPVYEAFLEQLTAHFRHILYGREEDVAGIHVISYFIGRLLPQLRDRPISRSSRVRGTQGEQILSSISEIIPFARRGSLLRAIAHNQAQTMILGVNQLTTGLFRALKNYLQGFPESERERILTERILPQLPVYEILRTLRLYQDWSGELMARLEPAFPPGNSALVALREDRDALPGYLPFFQRELVRRHGVEASDFFREGFFLPDLLPALRPDLAVLLQPDLTNNRLEDLVVRIHGTPSETWLSEVARLLAIPERIRQLRGWIWDAIGESVYHRVQTFMELATVLHSFSAAPALPTIRGSRDMHRPPTLSAFLHTARIDDELRTFLLSALDYLSAFASGTLEVPVRLIRALNDVEALAKIEENAPPPASKDLLRYCLLHIARLAGENG